MSTITDLAKLTGLTERTVEHNGEHKAVRLRREYGFAVNDVWSAWTEPTRLARWLGEVRGECTQGSTIQLCMTLPDSDIATITILVCEAPTRLAVKWQWPGEEDSFVDLRLEPIGSARTALTLEHIALADINATAYGAGWEGFLVRVGVLLDGGEPGDVSGAQIEAAVEPMWTEAANEGSVEERWPVVDDSEGEAILRVGRWFPHPIDTVWTTFSDPTSIGNWFGRVGGDTSVGGTFTITFDGGSATGVVKECDDPRRLVVTWRWDHQDFDTLVTADFVSVDLGTRVTLSQSGVVGPALGYAAGWSAYLDAAERHLRGKDRSEAAWEADWEIAQAMVRRQPTSQ